MVEGLTFTAFIPQFPTILSANPTILVGCAEDTVWLRVIGKGTFQTSSGLKQYAKRMIARGYRLFIVDLAECEVMDSTSMGTLAGLALNLKEEVGGGLLQVIRCNPRNTSLLCNLGLDQLFTVLAEDDPATPVPPASAEMESTPAPKPANAQEMLEAHQALVEADQGNFVRFQDVLELLAKETKEEP